MQLEFSSLLTSQRPIEDSESSPLKKQKTFDTKSLVNQYYQEIIRCYSDDGTTLNSADPTFSTGFPLTPQSLKKVIKGAVKCLYKSDRPVNIRPTSLNEGQRFKVNKSKFIASLHEDKLKIIHFNGFKAPYLGKGMCSKVYRVMDLTQADCIALKCFEDEKEAKKEFAKYRQIHGNQPIIGIQQAPHALILLHKYTILFTSLFNKNSLSHLLRVHDLNEMKAFALSIHLCKAVENLHQREIIHGDIKPGNCLLNETLIDGEQNLTIVLGDLGGTAHKSSLLTRSIATHHTKNFLASSDWHACTSASTPEERFACGVRRDIFALAITVWKLCTRTLPYSVGPDRFANTSSVPDSKVLRNKMGNEVFSILLKALSSDPAKRPSLPEMITVFENNQPNNQPK